MSALHPKRTDDEVRDSIVAAAESCENQLRLEAEAIQRGDDMTAEIARGGCEWDGIRAFRMAECFA